MASEQDLKWIVEAALMAAGRPLNLDNLQDLFGEEERPDKRLLRQAIESLQQDYQARGIELREVPILPPYTGFLEVLQPGGEAPAGAVVEVKKDR